MQKIQPLFDRVVIEKIEQPSITPGGLHIPDDAKQPSQLCLVVEVGTGRNIDAPGAYRVSKPPDALDGFDQFDVEVLRPRMHVKAGDKVLIGKFSGSEVELEGRTLLIVREDEILAIVSEEQPAA